MNIAIKNSFFEIQELIASPPPLKCVNFYNKESNSNNEHLPPFYYNQNLSPDSDIFKPKPGESIHPYYLWPSNVYKNRFNQTPMANSLSNNYYKQLRMIQTSFNLTMYQSSTAEQFYPKNNNSIWPYHTRNFGSNNYYQINEFNNICCNRCYYLKMKPNLNTIPNEPLDVGEKYYMDLAGNIYKGPIDETLNSFDPESDSNYTIDGNLKNIWKMN